MINWIQINKILHKPVRSVINYVNNWGSLIISICAMECVDERVNKIVGHAGWCENWLVSKDIKWLIQTFNHKILDIIRDLKLQ